jgi:hypothetical protein
MRCSHLEGPCTSTSPWQFARRVPLTVIVMPGEGCGKCAGTGTL